MKKRKHKKITNVWVVGHDDPQKRNTQNGITLIALIITIIILLILATVSIRLVINGGILDKSKYAADEYRKAEADEQEQLLKSEYEMAKYEGKFSGTYTEYKTEKLYGVKIGDYVNYNEAGETYTTDTSRGVGGSVGTKDSTTKKYPLTEKTYTTEDLEWRVLGVNEKGELELISDNPTTSTVYLANEEGYLYGPDELDIMCNKLYGKGTDSNGKVVSTGARSLNVDDINRLGNYDPKTKDGYGAEWQVRYPTREEAMNTEENVKPKGETDTFGMQFKSPTDTKWKDMAFMGFTQTYTIPGADANITLSSSNPGSQKLTNTAYSYVIQNYVKQKASDGKNIADIITKGTGTSNKKQWLASHCVSIGMIGLSLFEVNIVCYDDEETVDDSLNGEVLFDYYGNRSCYQRYIRPVVSLSSDIKIEKTDANDGSTVAKACTIK